MGCGVVRAWGFVDVDGMRADSWMVDLMEDGGVDWLDWREGRSWRSEVRYILHLQQQQAQQVATEGLTRVAHVVCSSNHRASSFDNSVAD